MVDLGDVRLKCDVRHDLSAGCQPALSPSFISVHPAIPPRAFMVRLHLLGGLGLTDSDGRERNDILAQPKSVALLAYLAVAVPVGLRRRDELLGCFWPETDTSRGRRALSQALFVLRNALGAD